MEGKMNKYINQAGSITYLKVIFFYVQILFTLTVMSCQGKSTNLIDNSFLGVGESAVDFFYDSFLIYYLRNYPTLHFDTSENVIVQRIDYNDFDRKEINYSDFEQGTFWHTIYLFNDSIFVGIDNATTNSSGLLSRYKQIEIYRNEDGSIDSIDQYVVGENRLSWQHVYYKNDNTIIANDGQRGGPVAAVIVEEETRFLYFSNHQRYSQSPDEPETIIEFNNEEVFVTRYTSNPRRQHSQFYFLNGILLERIFFGDRTETYTVSSGIGEVIVTDNTGSVIEHRILERRINDTGYLEYEMVKYPSGAGYEYFFTKEMQ